MLGRDRPATDAAHDDDLTGVGHVLFVDDDDLVRDTVAEMLRLAGHRVTEASSGRAALETLAADDSVRFLLSDLSMPEMNGVALVEHARGMRPDLPAALLTGFAAEAEKMVVQRVRIFRKPADVAVIADYIMRITGD